MLFNLILDAHTEKNMVLASKNSANSLCIAIIHLFYLYKRDAAN